jgi:hypothetical protein
MLRGGGAMPPSFVFSFPRRRRQCFDHSFVAAADTLITGTVHLYGYR